MEQFFSVTRGRSATSTFCTYCGGCSVPRHIYCIAIIKSNQIYLDTAYLKMTQGCLQFFFFFANLSMTNAIYKYRDTYRIVAQVSRYVSHRDIRYRDNTKT